MEFGILLTVQIIEKYEGLLSLEKIEEYGVSIPMSNGNQWSHEADKLKGLHRFVHLAFIDDHPMLFRAKQEGRIKDPIWLKIKNATILHNTVRFSADVSNKTGVRILNAEEAIQQIDFDALFTYMDWRNAEVQHRRQVAKKAEILIPDKVNIEDILDLKNG